MRVLCINEQWTSMEGMNDTPSPVFNELCDVRDVRYFKEEITIVGNIRYREIEGVYYKLTGYKSWFHSSNFATLPDQTADEMSEESKEAIVIIENPVI